MIGELARLMRDPRDRILYSRSARDLMELASKEPGLVRELTPRRPLLAKLGLSREAVEVELDAERREQMHANERRLQAYLDASRPWASAWPAVQAEIEGLALPAAHAIVVERAKGVLPQRVTGQSE